MLTLDIKGRYIYILLWIVMALGYKNTRVRGHMSPPQVWVQMSPKGHLKSLN